MVPEVLALTEPMAALKLVVEVPALTTILAGIVINGELEVSETGVLVVGT